MLVLAGVSQLKQSDCMEVSDLQAASDIDRKLRKVVNSKK
jgi:hypothetical protein